MSTVILDTITGKSTATTITIGSTPVVSASANSMTIRGEGSAQTSIQGGLAKGWINFNGDGTPAIRDSQNVGSITDNGVGDYTINLSNNMASADYAPFTSGDSDPSTTAQIPIVNFKSAGGFATVAPTTSSFRLACATDTGTVKDNTYLHAHALGDLA